MEGRFSKFTTILEDPKRLGEDYTDALLKINENLELDWRNVHAKRFLDSVTEHAARQILMTEQHLKKLQSPLYYLFEEKEISESVLEFAKTLSDPKNFLVGKVFYLTLGDLIGETLCPLKPF